MLVFSCHSDTNFPFHSLKRMPEGLFLGHLDNFIGVYAMMKAYFSGRVNKECVRIELTYGEEKDYAGAYEVLGTLDPDDVVIVVDVTATPSKALIVIEKCSNPLLQDFIKMALNGMSFDLYPYCPDPQTCEDEVDVYSEKCARTCFLGVPVWGGDYNDGPVFSSEGHVEAIAEAICRIAERYASLEEDAD